jgi:membrane-bound lytic murein transglycosylase F
MFPDSGCLSSMRAFPHLFVLAVACCSLLSACDTFEWQVPPLDQADEVVVITINSPDTYYENADGGHAGLEFDLASEFARSLGKKIRFKVMPNLDEALLALENRQGHFAAGFIVSDKLALRVRFSSVYQGIQPQVAYNTDYLRPRTVQQLKGRSIEIASRASYIEQLNKAKQQVPDLKWADADTTTDDLLSRLAEGKIDYAIVGAPEINLAKNFYPNLDAAFDLGAPTGKAWALPLFTEREVLQVFQHFFDRIERDGTLTKLLDRYYGHIERLEQADVSGILQKRLTLLPGLRDYFYQAEELTGLDWRLIAALAYQESHWNPLAVSFRNVRGLMMLTETTADRMKVTDRLDVEQSILAGAKYLLSLKDRLPARIKEPDRTWMALAAYNQGLGHLEDSRVLAQRMGLNPDSWVDLKKSLPLLSLNKYFQTLKHGYARGGEAVILAESVRTYYEILQKYEKPYSWGFPIMDEG